MHITTKRKNKLRIRYEEVELDDFATEDLIKELERRGAGGNEYGDGKELLEAIYLKRRQGQDYQAELDQLIYTGLGKII